MDVALSRCGGGRLQVVYPNGTVAVAPEPGQMTLKDVTDQIAALEARSGATSTDTGVSLAALKAMVADVRWGWPTAPRTAPAVGCSRPRYRLPHCAYRLSIGRPPPSPPSHPRAAPQLRPLRAWTVAHASLTTLPVWLGGTRAPV